MEHEVTGDTEPAASRPIMPGYGILPADAGGGLLPWSWAVERLENARNYWFSTTRPDGRPHAMPAWAVWLDGVLYFEGSPLTRRARNLAANPALSVHLESGDDVVILEGAVEVTSDPAEVRPVMAAYAAKYAMPLAEMEALTSSLYRLRPRLAFAWLESSFPDTATRFRFEDGAA